MDYYNYNLELPFTKTKINFREINTKEQLLISKANVSFSDSKESLFEYNEYVLNVILNCVKEKEEFYKLNIIEYVLFLIKLRIISVGPTIDFLIKCDEENSKTKTKIQIDFKKYLVNLYNSSNFFELEENSFIIEKNLKLKLNWPSIKSISSFDVISKKDKNEYEIFNNTLFEFIEKIIINDDEILLFDLNLDQKSKIFEKIPISIQNKLQKLVLEAITQLSNFDLFEIEYLKDYRFNLYNLIFVEHVKMFFSYDLRSLYQEIYFLSSNNLPPDYIMQISNSERKIYLSIIEEQRKSQEKKSDDDGNNSSYSDEIKKLAIEFGEDLSK